jgi:hypothetical protein
MNLNLGTGERIPAEGGFLVPEDLRSEILMVALGTGLSSIFDGVTGYWTGGISCPADGGTPVDNRRFHPGVPQREVACDSRHLNPDGSYQIPFADMSAMERMSVIYGAEWNRNFSAAGYPGAETEALRQVRPCCDLSLSGHAPACENFRP